MRAESSPQPKLSVVVTVVGGAPFVRKSLQSLSAQQDGQPVEILVPYDNSVEGIDPIRRDYPEVRWLDMGKAGAGSQATLHELYDRRIAAGLCEASGEVVAVLQDTCIPGKDWIRQVIAAHALPHAVIGGPVEHVGMGALNWAVYFLDFGRYQLPLPEGPAASLTDVNISYKAAVLHQVKTVWSERFEEARVNQELARLKATFWQRPQMVVYQDRGRLDFGSLVRERLAWGRLLGSIRAQGFPASRRLVFLLLSPVLPILLVARLAAKVFSGGRNASQFIRSLPYLLALSLAWSMGEFTGYLTGKDAA